MQVIEVVSRRKAATASGIFFVFGLLLGVATALTGAKMYYGHQMRQLDRSLVSVQSWLQHLSVAEPDAFGDLAYAGQPGSFAAETPSIAVDVPAAEMPATAANEDTAAATAAPKHAPNTTDQASPPIRRTAQAPAQAQSRRSDVSAATASGTASGTASKTERSATASVAARPSSLPGKTAPIPAHEVVPTAVPTAVAAMAAAPISPPAPGAATAATTTDGVHASAVVKISPEQANIEFLTGQSVRFRSGRVVEVGELFPSGERLLNVTPSEGKIVTDRRVIILTVVR